MKFYISGRYTPWDESVLKKKTFEILNIDTSNMEMCNEELSKNMFCNAELIYGRFPANNFLIKSLLLKTGYFISETSLRVQLSNLSKYSLPPFFTKKKLEIEELDISEFHRVADIASDMFKFSRFHEDPFIDVSLANERMSRWVLDLANQQIKCLVAKSSNNSLISFMIYSQPEPGNVELILGGSKKGFELHSPYFWAAVITNLQSSGINKISTTISAANNGVLSLYQSLGFKITSTLNDYHKHIVMD